MTGSVGDWQCFIGTGDSNLTCIVEVKQYMFVYILYGIVEAPHETLLQQQQQNNIDIHLYSFDNSEY